MVADPIGPETAQFLEGGCSLVIGTVNAGNEPHASRGWGIVVLPGDRPRIRLVLDAFDEQLLDNLSTGGPVAVTAAHVMTLEAVQFKGHATGIEAAAAEDRAKVVAFCDAFFIAVTTVDGTPRTLLDRLVPADFVVSDIDIDDLFNQTPGPGAGSAMSARE